MCSALHKTFNFFTKLRFSYWPGHAFELPYYLPPLMAVSCDCTSIVLYCVFSVRRSLWTPCMARLRLSMMPIVRSSVLEVYCSEWTALLSKPPLRLILTKSGERVTWLDQAVTILIETVFCRMSSDSESMPNKFSTLCVLHSAYASGVNLFQTAPFLNFLKKFLLSPSVS